ncbi:MAG: hypothetical protein JWR38_1979 [Mucilaginibacter sp.]|nr:hypothetical protein [Mucilaginibacter sp.]
MTEYIVIFDNGNYSVTFNPLYLTIHNWGNQKDLFWVKRSI